jgi:hypothetical protein
MTFQQLYYTSCENGLARYGGYQFNAATPGVSPAVMRDVEDRTVYEPPPWLLTKPCPDEPEAYPIALSYATSEATGTAIIAHAVFAGADYSGRPGNYFVHALATHSPDQDLGGLLPVELWGAQLWRTSPVGYTDLPELTGPLQRGVVDRPGVQAFLDARRAEDVLPKLVTAVGRAMADERPVLLASNDAAENVWWIAAASYLLGDRLGRKLTFTTYSHRPGYSRYHLIGILADVLPPDAGSGFQLFDLAAGQAPRGDIHPLAALLASTGVMAAPGLWQQAAAFASGKEQSFDDWLAPAAVAAALLGGRLSPQEVDTVAQWLPGAADHLSSQHADIALGVTLGQSDAALADGRLLGLLGLARKLPGPARAEQLEHLLVERAVTHIAHGEPAEPVRLSSEPAVTAQNRAAAILHTATPATALALLAWAAACGVMLPDAELERYGRTLLDPHTPDHELTQLLRESPAILRGLLTRLASEPPQVTETVLAGPAGALIGREHLTGYPDLAELWLLISASRASMEPLRAFDEIIDIRAGAERQPLVDATLLNRLWPDGCSPQQLAELLGIVASPPEPEVLDWFTNEIAAVASHGTRKEDWLQLAQILADHPILPMLPKEHSRIILSTAKTAPLLHRARSAIAEGDASVFPQLFDAYTMADDDTRSLLERHLPGLLTETEQLGISLRNCPEGVIAAFCRELGRQLAPLRPDIALAERVFASLSHPDVVAQPALANQMATAFERVRTWHRRDIGALARALGDDRESAKRFQAWRTMNRGGLARKLFGNGSGPPAKTR